MVERMSPNELYSYDRDFDTALNVTRIEPSQVRMTFSHHRYPFQSGDFHEQTISAVATGLRRA